jgi:C-terminal processing protease CtpA/Prc
LEKGIAYLKMGTFVVWNFEMDWKQFLKEAFKTFEKANTTQLVIDIRGNEGGLDEVLEVLQQYILKDNCIIKNFEERVRYQSVPENLRPYLSTWDNSILDFTGKVEPNKDGLYNFISNNEKTSTYKGSKKAFQGDIYLLVDASNSSATFYLAKMVKDCGVAKLVGETTGGSKKGINGGNIFFLRLPNSRIEVDIPVYGSFNNDAKDEGISPDVFIPRTITGVRKGVDVQLTELLESIQ